MLNNVAMYNIHIRFKYMQIRSIVLFMGNTRDSLTYFLLYCTERGLSKLLLMLIAQNVHFVSMIE